MTRQLFEEALADVKKVKELAEDNAKRAIVEAVTPRIREFIDNALLAEHAEDGDPDFEDSIDSDTGFRPPSAPDPMNAGECIDDESCEQPGTVTGTFEIPDVKGKVTLDIDSLCAPKSGVAVAPPVLGIPGEEEEELPPEEDIVVMGDEEAPEEFEISLESIDAMKPLVGIAKRPQPTVAQLEAGARKIRENVSLFLKAGKAVRSTKSYNEQIAHMISRVENMYDYVQERVTDPAKKNSLNNTLEASFKGLNHLQESMTMSKNIKKSRMNEADVTLKLTGLPDDVDLDEVGVDLITGDEEEELGGEEGGEEDLGGEEDFGGDDFDLGGEQGQQGQQGQMESRRLSDDTIVEIDESMLRREISRMKSLREDHTGTGGSETKAQSWGNGPDHFDDFGGGSDEGEPTDAEIVDKSPAPGALPLGEADDLDEDDDRDDLDETDMPSMDEDDDLDESQDSRDDGGNVAPEGMGPGAETNKQNRMPEARARLAFEKKLQERAKARARALQKEAAKARSRKDAKRFNEVKKEYQLVSKRFTESVNRAKKVSRFLAEAQKRNAAGVNASGARPAGNQADDSLRRKLAETNLFNAKLLYTNKLLQNEQLTAKQKAQVIKQLDSAKTVREAKLVYESLSNTLAGTSRPVNESRDRQVLGSGSRVQKPASSSQTLNEGYEAERWAQLAGITRR